MTIDRYAVFVLVIVFAGCCANFPIKPVEESAPAQANPEFQSSFINVPVTVSTNTLETLILEELTKKPLSEKRSEGISARLLIEEESTETRIVRTLVRAAVPGHHVIKQVPKTITRTVKVGVETYKCLLRPWKWGHCVKDVFREVKETVIEETKVWIEAVAEEYQDIAQPFIIFKEKVAPTTIWLNQRADIRGISLDFQGSAFTVVASVEGDVSLDLEQGFLGAKQRIKGALKCRPEFELSTRGTIEITNSAELALRIEGNPDLSVKKLCVLGAVEAFDVHKYLNPQVLVTEKILGSLIEKKIKTVLQEKLDELIRKHGLHAQLAGLEGKLGGAVPISKNKDIWLSPRIEKVVVGSIAGSGNGDANALHVSAGLLAKPLVTATTAPAPSERSGAIVIERGNPTGYTYLLVEGRVPYVEGAKRLETALKQLFDEKLSRFDYRPGAVRGYAQNKNIVLAIEIVDSKSGNVCAVAYAAGEAKYDEKTGEIFMPDVDFSLDTRNVLLKAAAWLFDSKVEKIISEKARWSVSGQLEKANAALKSLSVETELGTLRGQFEPIRIGQPLLSRESLHIFVETRGNLAFVPK